MAKEKFLPNIEVRRLTNKKAYSLTFDGMKQSQGYLYYTPDKLLEGFMAHIGLGMTDQLNMENIQEFLVAAMNWNSEEKNVKEIARLNASVRQANGGRVAMAKRLMAERMRFVTLVDGIAKLANEFKATKDVQERLNNLIKNHKCPEGKTVTVKEVTAAPVSVFFNIASAKVASKKDLVNVQALADAAKANNKTIVVTGYADSKTGSASLNQTLSEKRANAVKAELVKMGVAEDKIEVKAAGGVNDIDPFAYNRRAVVEIK